MRMTMGGTEMTKMEKEGGDLKKMTKMTEMTRNIRRSLRRRRATEPLLPTHPIQEMMYLLLLSQHKTLLKQHMKCSNAVNVRFLSPDLSFPETFRAVPIHLSRPVPIHLNLSIQEG